MTVKCERVHEGVDTMSRNNALAGARSPRFELTKWKIICDAEKASRIFTENYFSKKALATAPWYVYTHPQILLCFLNSRGPYLSKGIKIETFCNLLHLERPRENKNRKSFRRERNLSWAGCKAGGRGGRERQIQFLAIDEKYIFRKTIHKARAIRETEPGKIFSQTQTENFCGRHFLRSSFLCARGPMGPKGTFKTIFRLLCLSWWLFWCWLN